MREPDRSVLTKTLGVAIAMAALLGATIWSIDHSKTDVAASPTTTPRAAPTPSVDPLMERRRVENARAQELRDAKNRVIALNTSLGVLFVRGVRIEHGTLSLTIDGSIWENETKADKTTLDAQMGDFALHDR